jgi:hypothetical protein
MSIPWTDTISVEPKAGNSAYGPTYGTAVTYKARVEQVQKRVTNAGGVEVVANLLAFVEPSAVITAGDRVTYNSATYEVVSAEALRHWTTTHHVEAYLISRA